MPLPLLIPLVIIASIFVLFFLLVVGAGLWEKRPIQSYYVPEKGKEYKPSPTAHRANLDAREMGFKHGGCCHDAKGKMYKLRYDFWTSGDNSTLAVIGSGTIAKMQFEGVRLYTQQADGRVLSTSNEIGEQDLSGVEDQAAWSGLKFKSLMKKHQARMRKVDIEPFAESGPMAEYIDIRRRQAESLVERGLAYYLDDDEMVWRYTLKGAITYYIIGVWVRPIRRFMRK